MLTFKNVILSSEIYFDKILCVQTVYSIIWYSSLQMILQLILSILWHFNYILYKDDSVNLLKSYVMEIWFSQCMALKSYVMEKWFSQCMALKCCIILFYVTSCITFHVTLCIYITLYVTSQFQFKFCFCNCEYLFGIIYAVLDQRSN